jgi:cytochrome P450
MSTHQPVLFAALYQPNRWNELPVRVFHLLIAIAKGETHVSSRKPVIDWATDFDYLDPEWVENPYPIWDELRSKCPIAHTDRFMGAYLPTRYEDVRAIASDTEHFSSRRPILRNGRPPVMPAPPLTSDPPAHGPQRTLLRPAFTTEAVMRLEPRIRAICRELIQSVCGKKCCDGAVDYAQEIPTRVTASMLGISEQAGALFRKWIRDFFEVGIADQETMMRTLAEVKEFFDQEISTRRMDPGDDLISYLLDARVDGQLLTQEHINGTLRLLLFAGIDTTWSAIGSCLWHLATHAEDRKRLVAKPELIPTAVEEFLRAYAPVTMAREVSRKAQINGCHFKEGDMVLMAFPAANRDPAKFPDADRVVIDRRPNPHIAFGFGIHRCVGAGLATMEMCVALQEWLGNIPEFALASGAAVQWSEGPVRGPRQLPLVLGSSE